MLELASQSVTLIMPQNINSLLCKYCLEEDTRSNLIMPCNCSGTQAFVHRACLDKWRTTDTSQEKFSKCSVCNTEYQYVSLLSRWNIILLKIKLTLLVFADISFVLIVSCGIISLLAFLSWIMYINQELAYTWNLDIISAGVIIGLIEFFSLVAVFGLLIIAYDSSGFIMTCCCLSYYHNKLCPTIIIFALFGIIIGIIAFIQCIIYRIHLRAKQTQHKINTLVYIVADKS